LAQFRIYSAAHPILLLQNDNVAVLQLIRRSKAGHAAANHHNLMLLAGHG
jgi:hypothetical protein